MVKKSKKAKGLKKAKKLEPTKPLLDSFSFGATNTGTFGSPKP